MTKWWHLRVLRHHVVRTELLGTTASNVWGFVNTCTCGVWWVETVWRDEEA